MTVYYGPTLLYLQVKVIPPELGLSMTEDDVKARFEKENIEIFFMTLFPASFEKDALSCISQEVIRLTQLLAPALKRSFDEDTLLQEKLKEYSQHPPEEQK